MYVGEVKQSKPMDSDGRDSKLLEHIKQISKNDLLLPIFLFKNNFDENILIDRTVWFHNHSYNNDVFVIVWH